MWIAGMPVMIINRCSSEYNLVYRIYREVAGMIEAPWLMQVDAGVS
jgi:hypothetical protein